MTAFYAPLACLLILIMAFAPGCRSAGSSQADQDALADWKQTLATALPGARDLSASPDSTFVLAVAAPEPTAMNPMPGIHVVVVETATGKVVLDLTPGPGRASWHDDLHLRFLPTPGAMRENAGPSGFLLDVRSGERTPFTGLP